MQTSILSSFIIALNLLCIHARAISTPIKVSGWPHGSLLDIYEVHFPNFNDVSGAIGQNGSKLVCKLVDSL
jgi:hypothetical protein